MRHPAIPVILEKSTTGRLVNVSLTQLGWRALAAAWPSRLEEIAAARFMTPPRATGPTAAWAGARRFTLSAGEHALAVWEEGDGPTVLLVHGWGGDASHLRAFARPLVEAGHHVVAFDLPAHGASTGTQATLRDLAYAVRVVGRKLQPIHAVIAHSLGATASALAAADGVPLGRLALLAPPAELPFFVRAAVQGYGLPATARDRLTAGLLARFSRLVGDLDALDLRRRAPAMTAPLLVVHDPRDREVPFEHGRAVAEAWPGARLERAHHLGHRRLLGDATVIHRVVRFVHELPRG